MHFGMVCTPSNKDNVCGGCAGASVSKDKHPVHTSEKNEEARVHRSTVNLSSIGELHVLVTHESVHVSSLCWGQ